MTVQGNGKDRESANLYLFIVTTNRILSYPATQQGSGKPPGMVDEVGTVMDWREKDIVVAREEGLDIRGVEGGGSSYSYEGSYPSFHSYGINADFFIMIKEMKSSVYTNLNHLIVITQPFIPSALTASATVCNNFAVIAHANMSDQGDITKVTVFDLKNNLVGYSGAFAEGVWAVGSQWGKVYVLWNDG